MSFYLLSIDENQETDECNNPHEHYANSSYYQDNYNLLYTLRMKEYFLLIVYIQIGELRIINHPIPCMARFSAIDFQENGELSLISVFIIPPYGPAEAVP